MTALELERRMMTDEMGCRMMILELEWCMTRLEQQVPRRRQMHLASRPWQSTRKVWHNFLGWLREESPAQEIKEKKVTHQQMIYTILKFRIDILNFNFSSFE